MARGVLAGGRGCSSEALGDGSVRGGGGTKLNVSATRLNSSEAHEVTDGHKRPLQQGHRRQAGQHHHGVDKPTSPFSKLN